MPDANIIQEWGTHVLTAFVTVAGTAFALRRKFSQDSTAIAHDKAESKLIATLMGERDTYKQMAEDATRQRMIDVGVIARLQTQIESGEKETMRLREELFAMRLHTRKLTAIIVRLDPQAAQMLQVDGHGDGIDFQHAGNQP